jgi:multidrug/hemolysin transport system ATP-binding protein
MSITVRNISKRFGRVEAVRDVSFDVAEGSLFAFLGENGAGKTTMIGCLTTVLRPDAGSVRIDGLTLGVNDDEIRRRIGVVFQTSLLDAPLTVRENLRTRGIAYGLTGSALERRIDELARALEVEEFIDRRYGRLSGGQRRRVDIVRALIHEPPILFLDEPTAGLDPASRERVWSAIRGLREGRGATVFLTTHYMQETEAADAVCIIDHGQVVAEGTPAELRRQYSSSVLTLRFADAEQGRAFLDASQATFDVRRGGFLVQVASAQQARELLAGAGTNLVDFEFRHGTMDDVFLAVTGREAPTGNGDEAAASGEGGPAARASGSWRRGRDAPGPGSTPHWVPKREESA